MKSKDYCIECLESEIISFNKYHEDPLGETELKKNTLDTLGLLEGYFKILEVKKNGDLILTHERNKGELEDEGD